jgi:hypothetical protein
VGLLRNRQPANPT